MSINQRIKNIRTARKISQEDFARSIGMSRGNYSQVELGNQLPTIKTLQELARIYNIDYSYLIDGRESKNVSPNVSPNVSLNANLMPPINQDGRGRPVYNAIATAGSTTLFNNNDELIIGYIDLPAFNDCLGWVRVTGDSMYPKYRAGDYIALKELEDMAVIPYGHVFYIITNDQKMLKYVRRSAKKETIILRSENKDYDDIDLPMSKVIKLYRVKGTLRDED